MLPIGWLEGALRARSQPESSQRRKGRRIAPSSACDAVVLSQALLLHDVVAVT